MIGFFVDWHCTLKAKRRVNEKKQKGKNSNYLSFSLFVPRAGFDKSKTVQINKTGNKLYLFDIQIVTIDFN